MTDPGDKEENKGARRKPPPSTNAPSVAPPPPPFNLARLKSCRFKIDGQYYTIGKCIAIHPGGTGSHKFVRLALY